MDNDRCLHPNRKLDIVDYDSVIEFLCFMSLGMIIALDMQFLWLCP